MNFSSGFVMHQPNICPSLGVVAHIAAVARESEGGKWVVLDQDAADDRRTLSFQMVRSKPSLSVQGLRVVRLSDDQVVLASLTIPDWAIPIEQICRRFEQSASELRSIIGKKDSRREFGESLGDCVNMIENVLPSSGTVPIVQSVSISTRMILSSMTGRSVRIVRSPQWVSYNASIRTHVMQSAVQVISPDNLIWHTCRVCYRRNTATVHRVENDGRIRFSCGPCRCGHGARTRWAKLGDTYSDRMQSVLEIQPRVLVDNLMDFAVAGSDAIVAYPGSAKHYTQAIELWEKIGLRRYFGRVPSVFTSNHDESIEQLKVKFDFNREQAAVIYRASSLYSLCLLRNVSGVQDVPLTPRLFLLEP